MNPFYFTLNHSTNPFLTHSFSIGYVYSFVAAGVFYWAFNHFFPHTESMLEQSITGEDIIAAQDEKNVERKRAARAEKRPGVLKRIFEV